ncbi:DNA-directed RNA polymerase subunit beta [Alkalicoccobacillus plakortidis]|uniref:DNA-directed RNA polymerase subunit beta n=1 Tax=Alkalicoccobacillus plakortidis TaxID=444060 RepID=A0ABT0XL61_9BACI|nr:DNA-directed RNA polymerase subunit beta [Alkalicoccobacillus plakortidis]MCM2675942.1 DNA-directed RNA polymerase subunit beta [Alkalicoccobacillus plakortidis]
MNKKQPSHQKQAKPASDKGKNETKAKPLTRAEIREAKAKQKAEQKPEKTPRKKKGRIRILPIWLRLYIILTLIGASLFLGMMVGYGTIGGGDPFDVFKLETWYHIVDLMKGVED